MFEEVEDLPEDILRRINRKLILAWQVLLDETCSRCGTPAWYGRHNDERVKYKIHSSVCRGCAADEEEEQRRDKIKGKQKVLGETTYPVPYEAIKGEPLPRRSDWLKAEYEKQKAEM